MYSQRDEEKYIVKYFGSKVGRFLDIGAFDGKAFSNTRRLAELGWKGVCVEPAAHAFAALSHLYKDDPNMILVNCAIAKQSKLVKFHLSQDAVSTLSKEHYNKWKSINFLRDIFIKTITVNELFDVVGYNFDFMNLDIEGTNWKVLQCIPIDKIPNLRAVCIEYDDKHTEVKSLFMKRGFRCIYQSSENIFLGK